MLAAFLIVCIWSQILYKDNIIFRFVQTTLVFLALANISVQAVNVINTKSIIPFFKGDYILVVPIFLGALLYTRLIPKYVSLSRIPIAIMVGVGLGLGMRGAVEVDIVNQIIATVLAFWGGAYTPIDNLIIMVGTVCSLSYFLFTIGFKGSQAKTIGYIQRIGRYFLMIAFGGVFGTTMMARLSWFTDRIYTIIQALGLV